MYIFKHCAIFTFLAKNHYFGNRAIPFVFSLAECTFSSIVQFLLFPPKTIILEIGQFRLFLVLQNVHFQALCNFYFTFLAKNIILEIGQFRLFLVLQNVHFQALCNFYFTFPAKKHYFGNRAILFVFSLAERTLSSIV